LCSNEDTGDKGCGCEQWIVVSVVSQ
jgi:hypothetical protein